MEKWTEPESCTANEDEDRKRTILERQLNGVQVSRQAKNRTVLSYATLADISLIAVSASAAIIAGALNPLLTVRPMVL